MKEEKQKLLELPSYLQHLLKKKRAEGDIFSRGAIENFLKTPPRSADHGPFSFFDAGSRERSRAFLKIQDGCDNRCAYCRVPLARGNSVSIPPETALQRAQRLIDNGYREIVLTGINISLYRNGAMDLCGFLSYLLENTEGCRFRLSSIEPEAVGRFFAEVCSDPRICPHFHLPVQSGSDKVLALSGRHYRAAQVREAVSLLRTHTDDPFIGVDIIVGLPGEKEEDFKATQELLQDCAFSGFHVFPYSPRPGTAAPELKDHVPERIVKERQELLKPVTGTLENKYIERQLGRRVRVVVEDRFCCRNKTYSTGLSENYLAVMIPEIDRGNGVHAPARREVVECRISRFDKGRIFAAPC
jgi:threonylcarbamoyladenosine tRNA methylthiotransferase MtaB